MKEVELKKYENDFREMSRPTSSSLKSGDSEFQLIDEN